MLPLKVLLSKTKIIHFITVQHIRLVSSLRTNMISIESNKLYLDHERDSEKFQAFFNWNCSSLNINKDFSFCRNINEKLEIFLSRIKTNIGKVSSSKLKKKKKKNVAENESCFNDIDVEITYNAAKIPLDLLCGELFFSNNYDLNKVMLKIMDNKYLIVVNFPRVEEINLPSSLLAGFPVYPTVNIKFGSKNYSKFSWFVQDIINNGWIKVGEGLVYNPSINDIGKKIKLCCEPSNGKIYGIENSVEAIVTVEAGPEFCPFMARNAFTEKTLPLNRFRIISYNILADLYATTKEAETNLFPYCPLRALSLDYRKQLYLKEIIGYNGDLVCLQEVDAKVFVELQNAFAEQNLEGVFTRKGTNVREGVATFYSTEKFRLIDSKATDLGNEIDINPLYHDIWRFIKVNPLLSQRFKRRSTVLQILILESLCNRKEKIIVGNTHLYFHPNADHIRLLQAGMILAYVKDVVEKLKMMCPSDNVSFFMCGDFNSTPDSGIYRLMTENYISSSAVDWKSAKGEEVEGLTLKHSFKMGSACGTPKYTTYTVGFSDCLDYIYYEKDKFNVIQVVPFPSEDTLKENVALPSVKFPSDHLALVSDFEWKSI